MPRICNKCGCIEFETREKGAQVGLYCSSCNQWIKWLGKSERHLYQTSSDKLTPKALIMRAAALLQQAAEMMEE